MLTYASLILGDTFTSEYSGIYGSLIVGAANVVGVLIAIPII